VVEAPTRRLMITGGTGLVGRELLSLEWPGWSVLSPSRQALDLRRYAAVASFLEEFRPNMVVHAAGWVGGIAANVADQSRFLAENALMGINLLEACAQAQVASVMNLGSSCMYPVDAPQPFSESSLRTAGFEPTNEGYALGKSVVEALGGFLSRESRATTVKTVIPCNLYGPHERLDLSRSHLVTAALLKAARAKASGTPEILVWGDGTARREFMHVADLARFLHWAVNHFEDLPPRVNVGVGRDWSVADYHDLALQAVDYKAHLRFDDTRPVGMKRKLLDVSLVRSLGFTAEVGLRDGLRNTVRGFERHYGEHWFDV